MRFLLAQISILLIAISLPAQDINQQVISSAGGYNVSADNSLRLSWTLGELVISTVQSEDNQLILTQGFQQSKLVIDGIKVYPELGVSVVVFPNPTSEVFSIKLESPLDGETTFHLADPNGRVVMNGELLPGELIKEVSMQGLPAGTYFLRIQNGIKLNVYKIIKL